MRMACDYPGSVDQLVVVDIAPRDYPPEHHLPTLDALIGLTSVCFPREKRQILL